MSDSPTAADHWLVVSLALVWPWIDAALYPWLARATRAGSTRARPIAYAEYLIVAWGFTKLLARQWSSTGREWSDLGFRSGSIIDKAIGSVLVLAYVAVALRARGKIAASPGSLAHLRQSFGRAEPLLPRTKSDRVLFAFVSISAGFVEELFYRGYLAWYLAAMFGSVTAFIASSALFGMAHVYLGRSHVVRTAIVGLVLAFVVLASGSLWPAIAIHATMDLVAGDLGWRAFARSAGDPKPELGPAR
jgi:membrane protease YdiL (CAAX protease family)